MWRQLSWVGVGTGRPCSWWSALDYRNLVRAAPVFYVIGLALLLTVFVLGRTVSGARRWIHLGPFTLQPSELFKLIFVLTLAWALTSRRGEPLSRAALLWSGIFVLLGVPFVLVVRQPDLGTALVLLPGARRRAPGGPRHAAEGLRRPRRWRGVALMPLAWFVLKEYQRERLLVYIDPFRDPLGTAYNVIQAKIAIGSGPAPGQGDQRRDAEPAGLPPGAAHGFHFRRVRRDVGLRGLSRS